MVSGRLPKFSTALLLCAAALVVGFFLGRSFRGAGAGAGNPEPVSEATSTAPANPPDAPPAEVHVAKLPDISAWERLRQCAANESAADLLGCLKQVDELSVEECAKAWDLFRRWPQAERQVLRRAIARRWASLDPENALQTLATSKDWEMWDLLGSESGRALVQRDPEAALAKLAQLGRGSFHTLLVRHVISALAETAPARAGEFLLSRPEYARDDDVFGIVGERWAKADPGAALAWASLISNGRARNKALQAVWTNWAERDPATVAGLLSQVPQHRTEGQVFGLFGIVARVWSKTDPGAALAWITSLPRKEDQDAAWPSFSMDVSQLGPDRALELLKQIPPGRHMSEAAARAAKELALEDPQKALAWAERLPEGDARAQALRPALAEWAAHEPTRAVTYIAAMPAGDSRTDMLRQAVARWASQDPEAAFHWSRNLPAGGERDAVITASASKALQELRDPVRVVQWLELVQQPEKRQQFVEDLSGHWARCDGAAAAEWLRQLPDADAQVSGHRQLARQWAFEDSEATARWMSSLPSGPARDAAIGAFVDSVDGYDPAVATAWATAIGSPDRDKIIRHAFSRWLERDGISAWNWLPAADLSKSLRNELVRDYEQRLRRQGQ